MSASLLPALPEAKFRHLRWVDIGRHGYPLIPDLSIGAGFASQVGSGGYQSHILHYTPWCGSVANHTMAVISRLICTAAHLTGMACFCKSTSITFLWHPCPHTRFPLRPFKEISCGQRIIVRTSISTHPRLETSVQMPTRVWSPFHTSAEQQHR